MKISEETIAYISALSKLSISPEDMEKAGEDLDRILAYIETMNELDTDGVSPMSHVLPIQNVFREDIVINQDDREELLKNTPVSRDECYVVPKTVE